MKSASFVFTIPAPPVPGVPRRGGWGNKALVVVGLGLILNAGVMLYTHVTGRAPDLVFDRAAFAQAAGTSGTMLGARGIYMMPGQIGQNAWGVYLLDVDSQTISTYRSMPESSQFQLMSVRSFQYDRLMMDFNNKAPSPKQVQKLVEDQRQRQELQQKGEQPTVDQAAKPDENLPDAATGTRIRQ